MERLTPYDDINEIAELFTRGLRNILGDQLAGFYLTGSLSYGGFDRGSSDLDFYAILEKPLSDDERGALKKMHHAIGSRYPDWAERIEIPYVPRKVLGSVMPPKGRRPLFNAGEFWNPDPEYGDNWLINLYQVRESGIALTGPDPKDVIPSIRMEDVRAACRRDLRTRWKDKLDSDEPFGDGKYWTVDHLQAFSVLTMCRFLYRAKNDGVVSKRAAAKWAAEHYPQWTRLIVKAEKWQMGQPFDRWDETLDFIRFTLRNFD